MTYPPGQDPYGYGQQQQDPAGWGQPVPPTGPQASQPGWEQQGWQQPDYQQPGYQQPGYQQPGYQQPDPHAGYQQPDFQQGYQPPGYQPMPPKKNNGLLITLAVVVVAALGLVIGAVVVVTGKDDDKQAAATTTTTTTATTSAAPTTTTRTTTTAAPTTKPAAGAKLSYTEYGGDWNFRLGDVALQAQWVQGKDDTSCAPIEENGTLTNLGCEYAAELTWSAEGGELILTQLILGMGDAATATAAVDQFDDGDVRLGPGMYVEHWETGKWRNGSEKEFLVITFATATAAVPTETVEKYLRYRHSDTTAALLWR